MACGTAVITSNCTALPEVAGDATLLVDPVNVNEIAEAINNVIENSTLRKNMRKKGLEQAKKFSWDKTATDVNKVLEQASIHKETL